MYKRFLCSLTALFMIVMTFAGRNEGIVNAEESGTDDPSYITEGTYRFTTNQGSAYLETDFLQFREDCFMRSSYLGCGHLAALTAQMALSAISYHENDPYALDTSHSFQNAEDFLRAAGFRDIEHNRYYETDMYENSVGTAVGRRNLSSYGRDYTLLAIVVRGGGYKQEWAGNFTIDEGGMHAGFRDARDEVLRFVKKYIQDHGITGNLKIWTGGHSRGASVSNLIGGFFAGGGIAYFGDSVSITPEDVYCYSFANSGNVREGISKKEELSVSASGTRSHIAPEGDQDRDYPDDTPGEAWTCEMEGTLNTKDEIYQGVRSYALDQDFVGALPPAAFGFSFYGTRTEMSSVSDKAAMLEELNRLCPYAYEEIITKGDYDLFHRKTFDFSTLSITDDTGPKSDMTFQEYIDQLMDAMVRVSPDTASFVQLREDGTSFQQAFRHTLGVFGMLRAMPAEQFTIQIGDHIMAALKTYLAYGCERIMEEEGISDETAAMTEAAADLFSTVTQKKITSDSTVDEGFMALAEFLGRSDQLISAVCSAVPADYSSILQTAFESAMGREKKADTLEQSMKDFTAACSEGYGEKSADQVRTTFYNTLALLAAKYSYDLAMVFYNASTSKMSDLCRELRTYLLKKSDGESYASFSEAADADLLVSVDRVLGADAIGKDPDSEEFRNLPASPIKFYREHYRDERPYQDMLKHYYGFKANISLIRRAASYLALWSEDMPFSTAQAIGNGATLYGSVNILPDTHYNEVDAAWMKAMARSGKDCDHYIEHITGKESSCTESGVKEHWKLHDTGTERFFADRTLSEEMDDIVIPAKGHVFDRGVIIRKPTETEEGLLRHTCTVCGETKDTVIPVIRPEEKEAEGKEEVSPKKTAFTCQDAGYPAGYAWNEKVRACQPGYLDASGKFHPEKANRIPDTSDPFHPLQYSFMLVSSLISASLSVLILYKKA